MPIGRAGPNRNLSPQFNGSKQNGHHFYKGRPAMPEKQCECSTSMDNVRGIWLCGHCDRECDAAKPCGLCLKHSNGTTLRINESERTDKPEPKSGNPTPDPRNG